METKRKQKLIKIGVIVPDRPGREKFATLWQKYLGRNIANANNAEVLPIVISRPAVKTPDLVDRCKEGIEHAKNHGCDMVVFFENDDWYNADYIRQVAEASLDYHQKTGLFPDAIGIESTYYYHLKTSKVASMTHKGRSSLFLTSCSVAFAESIDYAKVRCPFLDLQIWRQAKTKVFLESKFLGVGLKHGVGYSGGIGHNERAPIYNLGGVVIENILGSDIEAYKKIGL